MPLPRQTQGLRPHLRSSMPGYRFSIQPSSVRNASHSNRQKKLQAIRDFQERVRSDPCDAVFGKRTKPFWRCITPDFLKYEMTSASSDRPHAKRFAQATSFHMHTSQKAGSKPVVQASSSSWDSQTNEVKHLVYDPISGKMVPAANIHSAQASTPTEGQDAHEIPVKPYEKPAILSHLPKDDGDLINSTMASSPLEGTYKDAVFKSEHDELLAARKHLETLREQVQILERKAHSTLTRPDDLDAERPAVFEDGWDSAPTGLQTAFETEKEACEHGEKPPLEQELAALNRAPVQEINDGYSVDPSGMQTLFAQEQENDDITHEVSLEQEMVAMNDQSVQVDDGYPTAPKGMQTLFEEEQHDTENGQRKSLEDEVKAAAIEVEQPTYNDDYATEPTGLETLYQNELDDPSSTLERELGSQDTSAYVAPEDGYPTTPTGMQTLYEREEAGTQSDGRSALERELQEKLQTRSQSDGYSLEREGMQTLYERERKQVENGGTKSLEDEMRNKHRAVSYGDGYSTVPLGMQTHFDNEQKSAGTGAPESTQDGVDVPSQEPSFEDGYSTLPMGLQMMFRREKHDTSNGSRLSLEEEIKQKESAMQHEDGYSCAPMGMENSFSTELKASKDSLEAGLKSVPGEGDISPTVGKFATSNKWYKQPATSNFSEELQKAKLREQDGVLFRGMQDIHGIPIGLVHPDHRSLQPELQDTAPEEDGSKHGTTIQPSKTSSSTSQTTEASSNPPVLSDSTNAGTTEPTFTYDIAWAEPAVYKIVAYDSSKDAISITTTHINFTTSESPISISHALSQLDQAARFIPHFAALQNEGFQVIHANRDLLALRKVDKSSRSLASKLGGAVNPVDGTSKQPHVEPPTARFASPTGFVNLDPIFEPEPEPVTKAEDSTGTVYDIPIHGRSDLEDYRHYSTRIGRRDDGVHNNRRGYKKYDGGIRKERRGRWRRRFTWLLSVGAGTAACTYALGVAAELSRPEKHVMRSSK